MATYIGRVWGLMFWVARRMQLLCFVLLMFASLCFGQTEGDPSSQWECPGCGNVMSLAEWESTRFEPGSGGPFRVRCPQCQSIVGRPKEYVERSSTPSDRLLIKDDKDDGDSTGILFVFIVLAVVLAFLAVAGKMGWVEAEPELEKPDKLKRITAIKSKIRELQDDWISGWHGFGISDAGRERIDAKIRKLEGELEQLRRG